MRYFWDLDGFSFIVRALKNCGHLSVLSFGQFCSESTSLRTQFCHSICVKFFSILKSQKYIYRVNRSFSLHIHLYRRQAIGPRMVPQMVRLQSQLITRYVPPKNWVQLFATIYHALSFPQGNPCLARWRNSHPTWCPIYSKYCPKFRHLIDFYGLTDVYLHVTQDLNITHACLTQHDISRSCVRDSTMQKHKHREGGKEFSRAKFENITAVLNRCIQNDFCGRAQNLPDI